MSTSIRHRGRIQSLTGSFAKHPSHIHRLLVRVVLCRVTVRGVAGQMAACWPAGRHKNDEATQAGSCIADELIPGPFHSWMGTAEASSTCSPVGSPAPHGRSFLSSLPSSPREQSRTRLLPLPPDTSEDYKLRVERLPSQSIPHQSSPEGYKLRVERPEDCYIYPNMSNLGLARPHLV